MGLQDFLMGKITPPPTADSPDYAPVGSPPAPAQENAPAPAAAPTGPVWDKNARNAVRDAWMSQGSSYGGDLNKFINENAAASPYKNYLRAEGDKLYLKPTVDDKYGSMGDEVIDAVLDYGPGGKNSAAWTGIGPGSGTAGNNVFPGGAPGAGGVAGGGAGGGTASSLQDPRASALFDLLMKRATQSENIDRNDPIVRSQSDAFNAQGQQARRDYLASEAEKAGPYGNQSSEERRSAEELGKSSGAFEAQAIANQQNARRQEIEQALSGAAGFLTQEQQMALTEELQKLNLAQQESQFGRNLGQTAYEFDTNRYDNIFGK